MDRQTRFTGKLWAYSFALWTAYSLAYSGSVYFWYRSAGQQIHYWGESLFIPLLNHWINAALTPIVLVIALRNPIRKHNWFRALPLHFLGMLAFTASHMLMRLALYPVRSQFTGELASASVSLFRSMFWYGVREDGLGAYLLIVVLAQLLYLQNEAAEKAIQAGELRSRLAEARLEALKLQLKPHFLFNTLNAVSELVHQDPLLAEEMVLKLSELLRFVVRSFDRNLISVAEELGLLKLYVAIEQIRFAGRLRFDMRVEESALRAQVPCLMLQPIVENAIGHGIGKRSGSGSIALDIRSGAGMLLVQVSDDGPGLPFAFDLDQTEGVGIRNTRERLQHLFPGSSWFEISNGKEGGAVVRIKLPFIPSISQGGDDRDDRSTSSDHRRRAAGIAEVAAAHPRGE